MPLVPAAKAENQKATSCPVDGRLTTIGTSACGGLLCSLDHHYADDPRGSFGYLMGKRRNKSKREFREPVETELRLAGEPDVLETVFEAPCLAPMSGDKEKVSDLESRYFDTPGLELRARGLAFRVRANGGGYKQTLKAGDDDKAALLRRLEWETTLKDDRPRPEALPKDARSHLPKAAFGDGLTEAFATRMRRRARKIKVDGAGRVEAALDLGEIDTGGGSLPIAEIELELIKGRPEALYSLGLELQKAGPLWLETRSKSARAFDQLTDQPPSWHRGMTPLLQAEDSISEAMAAIFESCFSQWLANQAAAIDGRDSEGVHQMRVALRRLRSALSAFRRLIPKDQLEWLQIGAKKTISALGPARDWDVFQADLLAPVIKAGPAEPGLKALKSRARARCRQGYRRARRHLVSEGYTRFVLRFGQWLERRAWRQGGDAKRIKRLDHPIATFAGKVLQKRHERVIAKGRGFSSLPIEQRHELRIALKKLRYSLEFFRPLFDQAKVQPFLKRAKALQKDLGLLNDVAVAECLLGDLMRRPGKQDISAAAGLVIGWHARGVAAVEPDLCRDWKAFRVAPAFWR